MESSNSRFRKGAWSIAVVIVSVFTWFGSAGDLLAAAGNKPRLEQPVAKISGEKATEIALKEVPGKVTSVVIERKRGKNVYVVEIIEKSSGGEVDVLVDMKTGKVLGTER
ncbi:PepSY domain-containing protein [Geotalea uraniireducens]|uniref:Propeptide, PepSY amd peptidase M4 n=1 Tax=Geotalea uraniireducens (strain Rf4) TaxID=351605 RepID=A5G759_GEOUR|nr:PepSY domain-containing protein [Geotalea uraniireducens]ABQ27627.1 Propeptide, PepSY amd peptidase M4 [Geotalea uraniireducens Rf4]